MAPLSYNIVILLFYCLTHFFLQAHHLLSLSLSSLSPIASSLLTRIPFVLQSFDPKLRTSNSSLRYPISLCPILWCWVFLNRESIYSSAIATLIAFFHFFLFSFRLLLLAPRLSFIFFSITPLLFLVFFPVKLDFILIFCNNSNINDKFYIQGASSKGFSDTMQFKT